MPASRQPPAPTSARDHSRLSWEFREWSPRTGWDGTTWGANQRITVDEAIRVNTINGAYASREETLKGSISEGKLADFVILADDPHTVPAEKIKDIQIVRTVVGGKTQFQA